VLEIAQPTIARLGNNNLCDTTQFRRVSSGCTFGMEQGSESDRDAGKGSYMLLSQAVDVVAATLI